VSVSPARILVIDDEVMNREMLEAHLELAGYEVLLAHSGEQALKQAATRPPDLILMDARMPGMDGYETCRRFKASDTTRHIPIILISGLTGLENIRQALDAGVDDLMTKPVNSLLLLKRIKTLLQLKALQESLQARDLQLKVALKRHLNDQTTQAILEELQTSRPIQS
jgi:PleD family two-component response regulator